jgi:tryptophan synthase beta subunit
MWDVPAHSILQPDCLRNTIQKSTKREDLNHTGAQKINNTIGQILVAQKIR